jgi:hypothetical protein
VARFDLNNFPTTTRGYSNTITISDNKIKYIDIYINVDSIYSNGISNKSYKGLLYFYVHFTGESLDPCSSYCETNNSIQKALWDDSGYIANSFNYINSIADNCSNPSNNFINYILQ